jgi:tripartite-type tricarboxylate transporter receptor subunit TctC
MPRRKLLLPFIAGSTILSIAFRPAAQHKGNDPGKLGFATDGPRNFSGILAAWINKLAGTSILQVPYATMPQGVQDTVAGRLQLVILAPAAAAPFMSQGQLHPLAVSSINRAPRYQSVPSIAETFPGVELIGWFALIGPKGTGSDVVQGLNRALDRVLNEPDLVRKLTDLGFYTEGAGTPEATRDYIRAQHAMWGKVAYDIGLEPQ